MIFFHVMPLEGQIDHDFMHKDRHSRKETKSNFMDVGVFKVDFDGSKLTMSTSQELECPK